MQALITLLFFTVTTTLTTSLGFELSRIVGGEDVSINKHPHQVSLRKKLCDNCPYQHVCGGSIVSKDHIIVTAAHCVYKTIESNWLVVAGTDNRAGSDGVVAPVKKIIIHENYNATTLDNDLALLILSTSLPLNGMSTKTIEIVEQEPSVGAFATITGWGYTSEGGTPSNKLQGVEVKILNIMECKRPYGDRLHANMLCAGALDGEKDACNNDSGGPLVSQQKLVGIVSWGTGCARPGYPGVYTNTAYFKHWIDYTIQQHTDSVL